LAEVQVANPVPEIAIPVKPNGPCRSELLAREGLLSLVARAAKPIGHLYGKGGSKDELSRMVNGLEGRVSSLEEVLRETVA
jgi:hypothetical protein